MVFNRVTNKLKGTHADELFPELKHPITFPEGETEESLLHFLKGFSLDNSNKKELEGYLTEDYRRFVYTLNLLGNGGQGRLLEIGANPYFTSILLRKFTNFDLSFTNYFGVEGGEATQTHVNEETNDSYEFTYKNHNIDGSDLPFEGQFDVVLFCEVLEHLINDPQEALMRIKKSLKTGGHLILTTPNVNRLENISRMIAGANIYDPYSGYGIYGRHNREYNRHELSLLLDHLGFEIEEVYTSDVHPNHASNFFSVDKFAEVLRAVKHREHDLGQYIFIRAKNVKEAKVCKPSWLFRSYEEGVICD